MLDFKEEPGLSRIRYVACFIIRDHVRNLIYIKRTHKLALIHSCGRGR
jgi:hypothetical protein